MRVGHRKRRSGRVEKGRKLGSRHLRVVSPMWRVKVTIDEILDRIDPEETITESEEDAEVEEEP